MATARGRALMEATPRSGQGRRMAKVEDTSNKASNFKSRACGQGLKSDRVAFGKLLLKQSAFRSIGNVLVPVKGGGTQLLLNNRLGVSKPHLAEADLGIHTS